MLETNPTFWKLVQKRRKQPTLSFEELKSQVDKTWSACAPSSFSSWAAGLLRVSQETAGSLQLEESDYASAGRRVPLKKITLCSPPSRVG
ncbi:MAG: hypothetical protein JRI36_06540 [Deltaproteobacteria bacterium]|nr:hypothetical protein [Deltaproteobacteria bacterium]